MKILEFLKNHQRTIVLVIGYMAATGLGFGIGQMTVQSKTGQEIRVEQAFAPLNNSGNSGDNQSNNIGNVGSNASGQTNGTSTTNSTGKTSSGGLCNGPIKGNINSKGDKIYHIPGGSAYNRTDPEQCFMTEAEAAAAGFRKAGG